VQWFEGTSRHEQDKVHTWHEATVFGFCFLVVIGGKAELARCVQADVNAPETDIKAERIDVLQWCFVPKARLSRPDNRLCAAVQSQLAQNDRYVVARGAFADAQALADGGVVESLSHEF